MISFISFSSLSVKFAHLLISSPPKQKVRTTEVIRTEKHITPIAATQLSTNYKRTPKRENVLLPKIETLLL